MPVKQNPMAALRQLREGIRDAAQQALRDALTADAAAQQALVAAEEAVRGAQQRLASAQARAGTTVAALQQRERFISRRRDELGAEAGRRDAAAARRREAAQVVAAKREGLAQAQVEVEVAEKAAERWDEAQLREAQCRAEAELEELVSARAGR